MTYPEPNFKENQRVRAAVRVGRMAEVEKWLDAGASLNEAMHEAIINDKREIVRFLLKRCPDKKNSSMVCAAANGEIGVVELLLTECGADVHALGDAALYFAASDNNLDMARLLLRHGANMQAAFLDPMRQESVSQKCNREMVDFIESHGVPLAHVEEMYWRPVLEKASLLGEWKSFEGESAEIFAPNRWRRKNAEHIRAMGNQLISRFDSMPSVQRKAARIVNRHVDQLLSKQAAEAKRLKKATDRFCAAVLHRDLGRMKKALEDGADVHTSCSLIKRYYALKRDYALLKGITWNDLDMVSLLLDHGADVHVGNDLALRYAATCGHTQWIPLLLAKGADVHADDDGALRGAAAKGHAGIIELLLAAGANVHARENAALRAAAEHGHSDVVTLLLNHQANVNAGNDEALRLAAQNGHEKTVRLLLDRGANVAADDYYALYAAAANGHAYVIRLLLDKDNTAVAWNSLALCKAAENGHDKAVGVILARAVTDRDCFDAALLCAVRHDRTSIIERLMIGIFDMIESVDVKPLEAIAAKVAGLEKEIWIIINETPSLGDEALKTVGGYGRHRLKECEEKLARTDPLHGIQQELRAAERQTPEQKQAAIDLLYQQALAAQENGGTQGPLLATPLPGEALRPAPPSGSIGAGGMKL